MIQKKSRNEINAINAIAVMIAINAMNTIRELVIGLDMTR